MIARNVGVEVEPDPFDLVVVWAVGREEVEEHAVAELAEEGLGLLARMNDVIVDGEVNASGVAVLADDLPHEFAEQVARLGRRLHPGEFASLSVERASDRALLVLARRDDVARWPGSIQSRPIFGLRWTSSVNRPGISGGRFTGVQPAWLGSPDC